MNKQSAGPSGAEYVGYAPSAELSLRSDDVHLWRAWLDRPSMVQDLFVVLTTDEQQRARRFHFTQDQQRFIIGRGLLRRLLGWYLDIAPDQVPLLYGPRGKPMLTLDFAQRSIQFNLTHSSGLALYAIAHDRELGVDLERLRPFEDALSIAKRYFTHREYELLGCVPEDQLAESFFRCWVRKEAYLKACGDGFARESRQIEISATVMETPEVVRIARHRTDDKSWSMYDLRPHPMYLGALCVEGTGWNLRYFEL